MLCSDHEKVRPDILILGKALSGGYYPISAVLCDDHIMNTITPGVHGSTYGGNSLACAVGMAAIKVLQEEKLAENSAKMGEIMLKELKKLKKPYIKDIRGKGLFCAIEFDRESKKSAYDLTIKLRDNGILAKPTHEVNIRLAPPLVINKKELMDAMAIFKKTIDTF